MVNKRSLGLLFTLEGQDKNMKNTHKIYPSFMNPEITLTTYGDKRLMSNNTSECWHEQEDIGPTFLVIRLSATDEQLQKLSTRFHMDLTNLKSFRDIVAI